MILIITHKQDYTADFVINKLNQRGIRYERLNCEDLLSEKTAISIKNGFNLSILNYNAYKSIWFRRTKLPELNDLEYKDKLIVLTDFDCYLKNLFSVLEGKWLSKPQHVYQAENKFLQLKIAKKIGFDIPQTLVTNSKSDLVHFYNSCGKKIIIKPISQTRATESGLDGFIFTNIVPDKFIQNIQDYDLTPCIFQEYIEKDYEIRVTVVGDKLFSAAIDSQTNEESSVDWRRKKIPFRPIYLPEVIRARCLKLVQELNLNFGAIDLIKTPENTYFFLEINPNGQWAWIEAETELPISEAIIDYLTT